MFANQIKLGVVWLDRYSPGWLDKDYSGMDMQSSDHCIATKSGEGYDRLLNEYGREWINDHGFAIDVDYRFEDYRRLTQEWHEAIAALRKERDAVPPFSMPRADSPDPHVERFNALLAVQIAKTDDTTWRDYLIGKVVT